jgi:hypothetical protein
MRIPKKPNYRNMASDTKYTDVKANKKIQRWDRTIQFPGRGAKSCQQLIKDVPAEG